MNLTFREIIWIIFCGALSIIAVRFSFTFDLNRFLENRRNNLKEKARNACPHCIIIKEDRNFGFQSTFVSPPGTIQWFCQQCWLVMYSFDKKLEEERIKNFIKHPEEFDKQNKKFEKLLRKAGLL